jgi:TPR repeat
MKYLYLLILSLILCNVCFGQTESFDTLLNRGKSQFKSDLEKPDYNFAINNLKKAIELNPTNAEAH